MKKKRFGEVLFERGQIFVADLKKVLPALLNSKNSLLPITNYKRFAPDAIHIVFQLIIYVSLC